MTKMLLAGCNGRMGKVITELVSGDPEIEICAGVDIAGESNGSYPVYASFDEVKEEADVIVEFGSAKVIDAVLDYAVARKIPAVVCSTGMTEEQISRLEASSREVAILRSANMSLGINLLSKLVKEAAQVLSKAGFDIEIVERHHNQKKDAPSGTALMLADSARAGVGQDCEYIYDRTGRLQKRDPNEIGISAVRGGTIPGTHEVIFAGTDEVIELNHMAYSRSVFGKGAISAAKYLAGKSPKLYSMADVIG